jgi:N-methylhydantoinase B
LGNADLAIQVCIKICEDQAEIDFSGTAPQTVGCVNTIMAVTVSSVLYVFRCLLESDIPCNAGLLRPLRIIAPEGSLLNARFPSAVVGGNVETSQRIVDVLFGALAQALPKITPAASYGTMNNLMIGGLDTRSQQSKAFAYYETIAGGHGASSSAAGASGKQAHMTNTLNTPIEALELSFPFRVHAYHLRQGSGGQGQHCGGDGVVRDVEILSGSQVTILSERRRLQPFGLAGGQAGQCGVNHLIEGDQTQILPGKASFHAKAGSRIRIETPGGGGWGHR